jgi:hypothetical protein
MTDTSMQLALSISVPTIAVLIGILVNNSRLGDLNSRLGDVRADMNTLRADMNTRFDGSHTYIDARFDNVERRFDSINQRFDDAKAMWRSEMHRVEEVLDARLKHLEER